MEIERNITVKLSENDVKEIIVNYLKNEGYITETDDITLVVGSRLEGYGMGEYQVNYFDCAYVKCSDFNKN